MNALSTLLSHEIAERLGWTLLHSLWQATAVALLLAVVLRLLARSSAQTRYAVACAGLVAMALLPAATGGLRSSPSGSIVAPASQPSQPVSVVTALRGESSKANVPAAPLHVAAEPRRKPPWRDVIVERLESILPYVVCVWLVGVLLFSLRHLLAWTRLRQLRRKQIRPAAGALCDRLSSLARRLGVERVVTLVESGLVQVPTAFGWLRPIILLPACAATGLPADHLEALLLHELAHIRRCDYLVNLAQTILEILGFYHPAVWWVSGRIRIERENCCDDMAARALGDNLRYARALASMEDLRADRPEPAMAASGGSLLARIRRLVGRSPNEGNSPTWAPVLVVSLLLLVAAVPVGLAIAEEYAGPTNELERAVLKGFGENRDKFTCGVLAWTRTTELHGDAGFPVPEGGLRSDDRYGLWWDGDKVATRYTVGIFAHSDTAPPLDDQTSQRGEDGVYYWIQTLEHSELYIPDSRVQESPWIHDNWFTKVIQWRGRDSLDRRIIDERHKSGLVVEWATTDVEGSAMIRRTVKNEDSGGYSIELYDPARGCGLVRRESFTAQGQRQLSQTARLQEVVPGAWFPVEVDTETIRAEDGFTIMRRRATLDLEQCHFNDRSALPAGVFEQPPRANQSELREVLQEIQQEQASAQTADSTAGTEGPRTAVEGFLIALVHRNREEAAKWLPRGRSVDYLQEFEGWLDDQDVREMAVIADDQAALVVTSAIYRPGKRAGPLMFSLVRSSDDQTRWLIDSMHMQTSQVAKREIGQFLDYHPSAVMRLMPDAGKRKAVHFPTNRSIGTLYTREWDFPTNGRQTYDDWHWLGHASGDVTVPDGKALRLNVRDDACQSGALFATLGPDDVQMLDFSECKSAKASLLADVAKLHGLKALNLAGTAMAVEGLATLKNIKSLKWLSLEGAPVYDKGKFELRDLGALEYLDVGATGIGDDGSMYIARIEGLKSLYLDNSSVTDWGLGCIVAGVKGLRSLGLSYTDVTDTGLAHIKDLTTLQDLRLAGTSITDEGLANLAGLTQLRTLDLSGTQTTDRGLVHLSRMQDLRDLHLASVGIQGEGLVHLGELRSLETLDMTSITDVSDEQLAHMTGLDQLRSLLVIGDSITGKGLKSLAELESLKGLSTGGRGITDTAMPTFATFPSLKSLAIQGSPITNDGLSQLVKLTSLTKLWLIGVDITGEGLAAFKGMPSLKELTLDNLAVGHGEFSALGELDTLEHLGIGFQIGFSKMTFSDQDMACLAKLKNLKSLTIVSNHVSDEGLRYLAELPSLESLRLSGDGITNAGMEHLEGFRSLRHLYLSDTRVTREAAERLRKAIPGLECRL